MSEEKEKKSWQDTASDWLFSIIIAVVLALGIRTFLVEPYMVSGPSMRPTLQNEERLIVNKLVYYLREPQRGKSLSSSTPVIRGVISSSVSLLLAGIPLKSEMARPSSMGKPLMKAISRSPFIPITER